RDSIDRAVAERLDLDTALGRAGPSGPAFDLAEQRLDPGSGDQGIDEVGALIIGSLWSGARDEPGGRGGAGVGEGGHGERHGMDRGAERAEREQGGQHRAEGGLVAVEVAADGRAELVGAGGRWRPEGPEGRIGDLVWELRD